MAVLCSRNDFAMEFCGAELAGISVLEPQAGQFRWLALKGVLSAFEGATTPREFSPCSVCLDENGPVLMENPERVYDWIRDVNISVPEVLLVPLVVKGRDAIGTLWIIASVTHHFNGRRMDDWRLGYRWFRCFRQSSI